MLENAKLRQEIRESEARTAAITNPSHSISATVETSEEIRSEVPSEVSIVAAKFRDLPQEEIAKIYTGKFKPINLYKLRYGKKIEDLQRGDRVTADGDGLSIKKAVGTMKDYGTTSTIWSESFLNYSQIMVSIFGTTTPDLFFALGKYHHEILDLAQTYEWQQAVLPLAIEYHTQITESSVTEAQLWNLPPSRVSRHCNSLTVLRRPSLKRKRSKSPSSIPSKSSRSEANDKSVICNGFNGASGCSYPFCKRDHKCKKCGSRAHGERGCRAMRQR